MGRSLEEVICMVHSYEFLTESMRELMINYSRAASGYYKQSYNIGFDLFSWSMSPQMSTFWGNLQHIYFPEWNREEFISNEVVFHKSFPLNGITI